MTTDGKLSVCDDICEQMAKFNKLRVKKNQKLQDCLKFFQATLSTSIGQRGQDNKKFEVQPQNLDIDLSKRLSESSNSVENSGSPITLPDSALNIIDQELEVIEKLECVDVGYLKN